MIFRKDKKLMNDMKRTISYEDEWKKNRTAFTIKGVCELLEMALVDKCPNGNYGDDECILWSEMKRIINYS